MPTITLEVQSIKGWVNKNVHFKIAEAQSRNKGYKEGFSGELPLELFLEILKQGAKIVVEAENPEVKRLVYSMAKLH